VRPRWVQGIGVPGIAGTLTNQNVSEVTMWDLDGAGPLLAFLVVAGRFTTAGGVAANNIATWNPANGAWAALGSGLTNGFTVRALAVMPDGTLVAGGDFTTAGGNLANRIARWNGITWSPLGSGFTDSVNALAVLPNGDLVAGGSFLKAGTVTTNFIARWNGSTWSAFGTGPTPGFDTVVNALAVLPNGDLIAGGDFTATATSLPLQHVARWTGSAWAPLGSGVGNAFDYVAALAVLPNGDLIASGVFSTPTNVIARWNGSAWLPLGAGITGSGVVSLTVLPNGDLIAGGLITGAGGTSASNIARWNGGTWSALGAGVGPTIVYTVGVLPGGDAVVGGLFAKAGGVTANNIARYNFDAASIASQPQNAIACTTGNAMFAVAPAGTGPFTFQWQIESAPNVWTNANNGTLPYPGGTITASSVTSDTLLLSLNVLPTAPPVRFRCVVANTCGTTTSNPATLTICSADFNCDGFANGDDFDQFVISFEAGDATADFNHDGFVNGDDFDTFVDSFVAGC